jgi:ADP-ribose pyrophosphatase
MTRRWQVREARVAHQTPYFRVVQSRVQRPDGREVDYHTIDFPRPAVAIALRDEAGRILLIRQQRFIVDRDVWALPSGGVEAGETLEQAALRELEEETGLRSAEATHLVSYYASYGVSNQVFHCFVAARGVPSRAHDENEVEGTAWFAPDEVAALMARGEIPDGLSLVPLLHLAAGLPPQPLTEATRCRIVNLVAK